MPRSSIFLPGFLIFLIAIYCALTSGAENPSPSTQPATAPASAFHGFKDIFAAMPEELLPVPGETIWSLDKRDAAEKWFDANAKGHIITDSGMVTKFGNSSIHIYIDFPPIKRRGMEITGVEYWINLPKEQLDSIQNHQMITFSGKIWYANIQVNSSKHPDHKFERGGRITLDDFVLLNKGEVKTLPPFTMPDTQPASPRLTSPELVSLIPDELIPNLGETYWPEETWRQTQIWQSEHLERLEITLTGHFHKDQFGPSVFLVYPLKRKGIVVQSFRFDLFNEKNNDFPFAENQLVKVTGRINCILSTAPTDHHSPPKSPIPITLWIFLYDAVAIPSPVPPKPKP